MTVHQIALGSLQISYGDDGVGPPVICIHSGGFTSRQWRRLRDQLAPTHRVLTPDLIGYGDSSKWPATEGFHFERDVEVIVALARAAGEPVHLVGHSYGAFLACHAAREVAVRSMALYEPVTFSVLDPARDADALAALDLPASWSPDTSGVDEAWLSAFVDWWNGPGAWSRLPAETAAAFRATGEKIFYEVTTLMADRTGAAFHTIAAPTLVMTGSLSPATEQRTVERLAELLPNGTMRRFDGLGHMGPITHHALVNAAIVDHLGHS